MSVAITPQKRVRQKSGPAAPECITINLALHVGTGPLMHTMILLSPLGPFDLMRTVNLLPVALQRGAGPLLQRVGDEP